MRIICNSMQVIYDIEDKSHTQQLRIRGGTSYIYTYSRHWISILTASGPKVALDLLSDIRQITARYICKKASTKSVELTVATSTLFRCFRHERQL